ncbi:neurensin-1 [Plakobranchus ocellatus]|uniref:Neurensin-1 n=1 Tax=Plakobranchus ocellatus TaxID=259542 RepID=A0AAV4CZ27_9GAST|nr:neurensin-1 [Plakobranchus ocellatus]
MAEYGEGYSTGGQDGDHGARPVAEEKHEVGGKKRASKDSDGKQPKRRRSCPMYFGVKSYLHHFYDDGNSYKDPSLYEDDDHQYLLQPNHRRRRCAPIWWKIFMWIGVSLLLFGVVGILVGYLVPPRRVLITNNPSSSSPSSFSSLDEGNVKAHIDERAEEYNTTLDMSKLVGLILFSVGGVTLAMALLFPSFLNHHCLDDDFYENEGDLRDITGGYSKHHHHRQGKSGAGRGGEDSLLEQTTIPASTKVKEVQPTKKAGQQMLTHIPQTPAPDVPVPGPSSQ